jgi:hypothetical protein
MPWLSTEGKNSASDGSLDCWFGFASFLLICWVRIVPSDMISGVSLFNIADRLCERESRLASEIFPAKKELTSREDHNVSRFLAANCRLGR